MNCISNLLPTLLIFPWALSQMVPCSSALQTRSEEAPAFDLRLAPDLWSRDEMLGDPLGWRQYWLASGVDVSARLTLEGFGIMSGGVSRSSSTMSLLDIQAEFDLERMGSLSGASALMRVASVAGAGISEDIGSVQSSSSNETQEHTSILELWYAWQGGDSVGFRAGKIDAGRDFSRIATFDGFVHAAAQLGDGSVPFPSDPDSAMGLTGFLSMGLMRLNVGVFNANDPSMGGSLLADSHRGLTADFDNTLLMAELEFDWAAAGNAEVGKLAVGFWRHNGQVPLFRGGTNSGQEGLYLMGEQEVWRGRSHGADRRPSIKFLGQFSMADDEAFLIERNLAAGLRIDGANRLRPDDSTGALLSISDLTGVPGAGVSGFEVVANLFHRYQWTPAIALTPDVQIIIDPAGSGTDALVLGLRIEIDL
ncbi:MAG: carbohydrate-selective porin OprB [Planctomycetota bacterium]|jgi:carbohydrate-selective porin OprB